ncbi:ScbR family autoregulator-binding transcription factor [Streptomyces longisporoflavus]|uniref:ScbR family autoregulator-binding transcription factor n=1 Tax=Streptomyces longisporoflavus TaxID=28044 RepID=A0ABW7R6H0_9ACTN
MPKIQQERAVRTRHALLRAGAEEFAERGYARASVADIASRAGLTLGALYFHFRSKAGLAREIVLTQPDHVVPPRESQGLQRSVDLSLTWAQQLLVDPLLLAGARLVTEQDEFVGEGESSHLQWTLIHRELLCEAMKMKEVKQGTDVEALARLIVNACTGAQLHSQFTSGRQDLPQRVSEIWQFLLPAITTSKVAARVDIDPERGRRS